MYRICCNDQPVEDFKEIITGYCPFQGFNRTSKITKVKGTVHPITGHKGPEVE